MNHVRLLNVYGETLHYRVANRHGRFVQFGRNPLIEHPGVPDGIYAAPLLYSNVGLVLPPDMPCIENDALASLHLERSLLRAGLIDATYDLTPVFLICQLHDHKRGWERLECVDIYVGETDGGFPVMDRFLSPTERTEACEHMPLRCSPLVRMWDTVQTKPAHLLETAA